MKEVILIFKWIFGILFIIGGFFGMFGAFITGLLFILLGLFTLPPTYKLFAKKANIKLPSWSKWAIVVVGIVVAVIAIPVTIMKTEKEVNSLLSKASNFIDNEQIDSAKVFIKRAKENSPDSLRQRAIDLEFELKNYNSEKFANKILIAMDDNEFDELKSDNLSKTYLNQPTLNEKLILILQKKAPERNKIIKEIEEKKKKERIAKELKVEQEQQKKRNQIVQKQFSPWDGSHPKLSNIIEKGCRNPDSYEHIETRFRDEGNYIFVVTNYRAENGFGGMSLGKVTAKVDLSGNVIEIVSQE